MAQILASSGEILREIDCTHAASREPPSIIAVSHKGDLLLYGSGLLELFKIQSGEKLKTLSGKMSKEGPYTDPFEALYISSMKRFIYKADRGKRKEI